MALLFGISEPNTVGQSPTYPTADGLATLLFELGAQVHRFTANGSNYPSADALYAGDIAHDVQPLIILERPLGDPPSDLDAWATFCGVAAARYPRAHFEIWNEPDAFGWGQGDPIDPEAYGVVLQRAYDAIKAVDSDLTVIGGALSTYNDTNEDHMAVGEFVEGMGDVDYDAFSFHNYGWDLAGWNSVLGWVRDALPDAELWITESGRTTTGVDGITEAAQAVFVVDLLEWAQTVDVEALLIHSLFERWTNPASAQVGYGLIKQDLTKKPAYLALQVELAVDLREEVTLHPHIVPPGTTVSSYRYMDVESWLREHRVPPSAYALDTATVAEDRSVTIRGLPGLNVLWGTVQSRQQYISFFID